MDLENLSFARFSENPAEEAGARLIISEDISTAQYDRDTDRVFDSASGMTFSCGPADLREGIFDYYLLDEDGRFCWVFVGRRMTVTGSDQVRGTGYKVVVQRTSPAGPVESAPLELLTNLLNAWLDAREHYDRGKRLAVIATSGGSSW